jgi:hypothetical protein
MMKIVVIIVLCPLYRMRHHPHHPTGWNTLKLYIVKRQLTIYQLKVTESNWYTHITKMTVYDYEWSALAYEYRKICLYLAHQINSRRVSIRQKHCFFHIGPGTSYKVKTWDCSVLNVRAPHHVIIWKVYIIAGFLMFLKCLQSSI